MVHGPVGVSSTGVQHSQNPQPEVAAQGESGQPSEAAFESTIVSTKENTESWGGMFFRYLFFIPNLIIETVKTVIHYLSFKTLFKVESKSESLPLNNVQTQLEDVREIWADDNKTAVEKKAAWDEFVKNHPEIVQKLDDVYIGSIVTGALEDSSIERKDVRRESVKKEIVQFIQEFQVNYLNHLVNCIKTLTPSEQK